MKKRISLLFIMLLLFLIPNVIFAEEVTDKENVPLDKSWTIKFNMPLDEKTINTKNIFITDFFDNKIECEIPLPDMSEFNTITISPLEKYKPNQKYILHIKNVMSLSGKALEKEVTMNFNTEKVDINEELKKSEFVLQGIAIGDTEEELLKILGTPNRKDASEYGFKWYIYNKDYSNYIQVGVLNGVVKGIYTNADNWISKKGAKIGSSKEEVYNLYKSSIEYDVQNYNTYEIDNCKVTFFYDAYDDYKVTSILLLDKQLDVQNYTEKNDTIRESYEKQIFDLANAIRCRNNKSVYVWDDIAANTARKHSEDMAQKNYFSHTNLDGQSPFDRMKEDNIKYSSAAENIAAGYSNAIFAHEGWMNSSGHRKNILGNCERLGVGVGFGGSYGIYYTQNFYTPW